jgi:hypothetical protein
VQFPFLLSHAHAHAHAPSACTQLPLLYAKHTVSQPRFLGVPRRPSLPDSAELPLHLADKPTDTHVAIQVMAQNSQQCLRERIFFLLDVLLIFVDFPMKVSQTT